MEATAGEYIKNYLHLKSFARISLHCKLVPVQYWEYDFALLDVNNCSESIAWIAPTHKYATGSYEY